MGTARAEAPRRDFGRLDHVFLIVMENQTDTNINKSPNAPFINKYREIANQATNYFAVGHPSLPNYLEIVGGSNFGIDDDYVPIWEGGGCVDNSLKKQSCKKVVRPISEPGEDKAVFETAERVESCSIFARANSSPSMVGKNCALRDYPKAKFAPKTIADQLVAKGKTWRAYEESLPSVETGVAGVNYSDGEFSNLSPPAVFAQEIGDIQALYAVKHNPFAYFRHVQLGKDPQLSLQRVSAFDGSDGLWADLRAGAVSNFSFIVPNQCHDMHGRVNGGTLICKSDTDSQKGLLISQGDAAVKKIVEAIHESPAWTRGRNAIVLVWDENDYDNVPNRVVMLVETNYAPNGKVVETQYDHFSLLHTLEVGFRLPCLNHACDDTSTVMGDMFGARATKVRPRRTGRRG
jgi:phosphatidylinositol-3-phosphatase